jgi:Kef-type K+ transport system membrane component KefB
MPLAVLLVQIIVIVSAGRITALAFRRLGQTAVIGEMFAGILLGPSLLGQLSPSLETRLFPAASLPPLYLISQLGVVLFMFTVGMDVDVERLRRRARATVFISNAGIIVPFALGFALSFYLHDRYAPVGVPYLTFALFIGIAMSITAFPVLARILVERGLKETDLGNTAIGCAAIDDVTAWCLLALALAIGQGNGFHAPLVAVTLTAVVASLALVVVRPRAARLFGQARAGTVPRGSLLRALVFLFALALATEAIGVHALFGAFIAGVAVAGAASLRAPVRDAIEPLTSTLLLPLFFAYAGLRTEVGQLTAEAWIACGLVLVAAVAGKFGAISVAARFYGFAWRDAIALGALMNTRGLMELVVLNIGYDLGILSPQMYTMMVIMALMTTCMAGPVLGMLASPAASSRFPVASPR